MRKIDYSASKLVATDLELAGAAGPFDVSGVYPSAFKKLHFPEHF